MKKWYKRRHKFEKTLERARVERSVGYLERSFGGVVSLEEGCGGNQVVLCFKEAEEVSFEELKARAQAIREASGLKAKLWVKALKEWSRKAGRG